MNLPSSPVSPQLSETVEALINARSKQNNEKQHEDEEEEEKTRENFRHTRTGMGCYKYDQMNTKSSSDPQDHLKKGDEGVGFLRRRLVRTIDLNSMRICKTLQNESSHGLSQLDDEKKTELKVEPIPCLSFLHPSDEKDVETEEAKIPTVEANPHTDKQVFQPRDTEAQNSVATERKPCVEERPKGRIDSLGDSGCDVPTCEVKSPVVKLEPPVSKPTSAVLVVNGREFNVMRELGQGGSSRVFEVYNEKRQLLAIKCVNLSCADKSVRDGYLNEIKMLQQLQGRSRIIKLFEHEYNREKKMLYVVMERGDVDLATFINQRSKREGITPEMIKFYWSEMLRAVQEIHSVGIIHSDLKPANFLLVAGQLKLIDFGIASAIPDDKTSIIKDNKCGTPSYMSPEALNDIQEYSEDGEGSSGVKIKLGVKSDVWSLGCILYHMVYGRTPFQHVRNNLKLQAITNPAFKIDFPPIKDKLLVNVLKCCIVRDVKQRASVEELLNHPFLTASTFLECLNELSPSSITKVSKLLEQFQNQKTT